jgi:anthranilate synthase component 1
MVLVGQKAYLQAGAGVVADSEPVKEYEETLNKAKGLLRALEIAEKQL